MGNTATIQRWYIGVATAAVLTAAAQNVVHAEYLKGVIARVQVLELRDADYAQQVLDLQKRLDAMKAAEGD